VPVFRIVACGAIRRGRLGADGVSAPWLISAITTCTLSPSISPAPDNSRSAGRALPLLHPMCSLYDCRDRWRCAVTYTFMIAHVKQHWRRVVLHERVGACNSFLSICLHAPKSPINHQYALVGYHSVNQRIHASRRGPEVDSANASS
jgi:hypothetical protein